MISGWEWIIILLAVVVILIWGPSKIPELAKGLGRAKAEFEKASKEYVYETPKTETVTRSSDEDMIILIAKGLGVATEGKTKDEIFREIIANIKAIKSEAKA
ncbi:MAG: twin-arginine translocase TatA/TatE family subunit [Candidatus Bathyarchaeia archaeon]